MNDPSSTAQTLESLPLAQRLALSYAPSKAREDILTLFLLDNRLASILRNHSELMLAQIKLAWWRDLLAEDPQNWPKGEPLLERLQAWAAPPEGLRPLVDGWERLLEDELTTAAIEEFAEGRAAAWQLLAEGEIAKERAGSAARQWALTDLALNLENTEEAHIASELALAKPERARLPRSLRPLAVLHGLSYRALKNGHTELIEGPRGAWHALRIGLTGR